VRLLVLLSRVLLLSSSAAQHVAERVVAFVTRVLVDVLVGGVPRILSAPRFLPRLRIVDGETIEQGVGVHARKPLDDMQLFARALELCLVREVRGIDDERIALPVPNGVAHPFPDGRRYMLGIHADDPNVMHHLDEDHDRRRRLHDLFQVVVEVVRQRWRA